MSIIRKALLQCNCGELINADIAEILNISTHPKYWPNIYSGDLNSGLCKNCNTRIFYKSNFIFYDTDRKLIINVLMNEYKSKEYMTGKTYEFINNSNFTNLIYHLPDTKGFSAMCVFNLEDLTSKIHASMSGFNPLEIQFIEYALEKHTSCDECNSQNMKLIFERSDRDIIVFRTICLDCKRISLVEYPIENYNQIIKFSKQYAVNENLIPEGIKF